MEKGYVLYTLFEHSPPDKLNISQSGIFLYKLDTNEIDEGTFTVDPEYVKRQPMGQPIFRFVPGKYPRGMGCGMLEGKLYFFGGYFPHQRDAPKGAPPTYSEKLYILDPTLIEICIPEELAEKTLIETRDTPAYLKKSKPIVVTVNRKLYVLPKNFAPRYNIRPSIQSYDPRMDEWNNYDIYELLKDDPQFEVFPTKETTDPVLAHCVEGSQIIIVLTYAAYSFDVETEELKLVGNRTHIMGGVPYYGLGAIVDGCYFGISKTEVMGYKDRPFGVLIGSPSGIPLTPVYACPGFFDDCRGIAIHLADAGPNKLLVVRSGYNNAYSIERFEVTQIPCLAFDFLCITKDVDGVPKRSRSDSIIYHMEEAGEKYRGRIIACLPMYKIPGKYLVRDKPFMHDCDAKGRDVSSASVVLGEMADSSASIDTSDYLPEKQAEGKYLNFSSLPPKHADHHELKKKRKKKATTSTSRV